MTVLRVLLVAPSFHPAVRYGGPTYASFQLACALGARGHDVRVLTTNAHGDEVIDVPLDREHTLAPGVRITYLPRVALLGESAAPGLPRRLAELVPWADVVHLGAVYNATTFPTLLAVRRARATLVWTTYGAHYYAERWERARHPHLKRVWDAVAQRVLAGVDATIVAESEIEADATRDRMPGLRVEVVREPVRLPVAPERAAQTGPLRVLFLARLHPIKGVERLLDALRGHSATVTIAGSGEPAYVADLRSRASSLAGRATFVGHVGEADKAALFARHDLLVLPSLRESYGIVVAEALAHGVPALVVRPTAWEVLEEAGAGIVVEPADLAARLRSLSREELLPMGRRARAHAERALSVDVAAERMIGLYERSLRRCRASTRPR